MERAEKVQIERVINHNLKERFSAGAVQGAVLLEHGDDPAIGPGQLMVRVFVPAPDEPADYERALAAWQDAHRAGMEEIRRELSLRLPSARLPWTSARTVRPSPTIAFRSLHLWPTAAHLSSAIKGPPPSPTVIVSNFSALAVTPVPSAPLSCPTSPLV